MMKYTIVSGVVFGLIALLQLTRAVSQWPVQVATYDVPVLLSWVAALLAGGLCIWAFCSTQK